MMKSPAIRILGMATWLITALASVNIGLDAFGMGFMTMPWMDYIILFSGIFSLGLMVMSFACGCNCGMCKMCKSDKKPSGNPGNSSSSGNTGGNNNSGSQRMCGCGKLKGQCGCGK